LIKISAPYRIYLVGEHASVYGEPAVLLATQYRLSLTLKRSYDIRYEDSRFGISDSWSIADVLESTSSVLQLWNSCAERGDFSELNEFIKKDNFLNYRKSVIGITLNKLNVKSGLGIHITSDLPIGSGLASSGALAVSLAKGITSLFDINISDSKTNQIAFEIEKIAHGTPSGADNSICIYGGMILFRASRPKDIIIQLKDRFPKERSNFILIYTNLSFKTTGELIQHVKNINSNYREARIKRIGKLSYEMKEALLEGNIERITEIINENHLLLAELGVSSKEMDKVASVIRDIGGAAKLLGGGGSGAMLCFHKNRLKLIKEIERLGYKYWNIDLDTEGVRIDKA
jgi:mevalonate kinase